MAIFYGFYLADKRLEAAFDLIRFLGEPKYFRTTHITVRGPYAKRIDTQILQLSDNRAYKIHISEVGHFFTGPQNTVFLNCYIADIEKIWRKPDYHGEIRPHLTLFDGKDRNFGYSLFQLVKAYKLEITTLSTPLEIIHSKTDPQKFLDVFLTKHHEVYDEILGRPVDYKNIGILTPRRRLNYIEEILNFLQRNYSPDNATHYVSKAN